MWSSRVSIEPAAWSFTYTDYWGTAVTTFELHERHQRLTVRAQAVVETRGDDLPWDTDRRVAENDLGWPALRDRGVTDSMSEFLTVNDRTQPPDELLDLAQGPAGPAAAAGRAGRLPAGGRPAQLPARLHPGDQHRPRGLGAAAAASARTTATWRWVRCARSASRRATCRATCFPCRRHRAEHHRRR